MFEAVRRAYLPGIAQDFERNYNEFEGVFPQKSPHRVKYIFDQSCFG
jgi:hypothetical protein